jgi:hypothetical protein
VPSLNYYTDLGGSRRVRVNVCEGDVHVTEEARSVRGAWKAVGPHTKLTREQAKALADTINNGLAKGY